MKWLCVLVTIVAGSIGDLLSAGGMSRLGEQRSFHSAGVAGNLRYIFTHPAVLAGIAAIHSLPIAQYPNIAPPAISIGATYPGASAKTLEDSVTQVIEQRMNGIDNMRYMASTSDSAGNVTITLTFDAGTNPDIAQVQVQNKLQLAMPLLPQEVQQQGVRVTKSVRNFLMVLGFVSTDGSMTRDDISTIRDA